MRNHDDLGCWEFMKQKPQLFCSQHTFNWVKSFVKKVYILIGNVNLRMKSKDKGVEKNNILNELTVEDAVLILLYANKDKPIRGRLMFVKQSFLLSKEVIPQLDEKFEFFPAHFGPFSKVFATKVDKLIQEGYIKTILSEDDLGNITHKFSLTDIGKEAAFHSFDKLSEIYKDIIIRKRKGWDQLGYIGILRLVYTKYPEYTVNSKIRDKVE